MGVTRVDTDLVASLEGYCNIKLEMIRNTLAANTLQNWIDCTEFSSLENKINLTSHSCSIFISSEQVFQNCHCETQFCAVFICYMTNQNWNESQTVCLKRPEKLNSFVVASFQEQKLKKENF